MVSYKGIPVKTLLHPQRFLYQFSPCVSGRIGSGMMQRDMTGTAVGEAVAGAIVAAMLYSLDMVCLKQAAKSAALLAAVAIFGEYTLTKIALLV